ncbi:Zinc finger and SCAN domain-containing protein 29 [Chelonia mydas]|uniref:Zinc finger and SCAN domain-containing protein 29 n=1 Tax=Chelonia mydas TaxID=8469 RepID=M7C6J9_CHEMY|nr:Zinc finger and SCAN domain-containing protein 29 [Chelonia mydas]
MAAPRSKYSHTWSTLVLLDLLSQWTEEAMWSQLHSTCRNFNTYRQISRGMLDTGYKWDIHQCRPKIKELRQAYQKARESNSHSGAVPKTCHFFKELNAILSGDPTSTVKRTMDTSAGLETANSRLNPKDREVELKDDVEHDRVIRWRSKSGPLIKSGGV